MVRICLHTAWSLRANFIGGTERFLIELAKELRILGFDPFVVCSNLQPEIDVEGVQVRGSVPDEYRTPFVQTDPNIAEYMRKNVYNQTPSKVAFRHVSAYVQEQLRDVEADIFHLNAFSAALFVNLPAPMVVTNHENEEELDRFWELGAFATMARLIRDDSDSLPSAPWLFTPSRHYAEEYSKQMARDIRPNALGVNLNEFSPTQQRYSVSSKKTVLMPSRFFPEQKGQDLALEACSLLRAAGYLNLTFLFTGVRDYYGLAVDLFRKEADRLGVATAIRIKNFARIQDAFEEADIVVSPERYCSYGLSVTEALSLGKPTVLSDIPTYLEIASGLSHAFFVKNDDAKDLAQGIVRALSYDARTGTDPIRFRMANDFRDCAKRYAKAYLELLGV